MSPFVNPFKKSLSRLRHPASAAVAAVLVMATCFALASAQSKEEPSTAGVVEADLLMGRTSDGSAFEFSVLSQAHPMTLYSLVRKRLNESGDFDEEIILEADWVASAKAVKDSPNRGHRYQYELRQGSTAISTRQLDLTYAHGLSFVGGSRNRGVFKVRASKGEFLISVKTGENLGGWFLDDGVPRQVASDYIFEGVEIAQPTKPVEESFTIRDSKGEPIPGLDGKPVSLSIPSTRNSQEHRFRALLRRGLRKTTLFEGEFVSIASSK